MERKRTLFLHHLHRFLNHGGKLNGVLIIQVHTLRSSSQFQQSQDTCIGTFCLVLQLVPCLEYNKFICIKAQKVIRNKGDPRFEQKKFTQQNIRFEYLYIK